MNYSRFCYDVMGDFVKGIEEYFSDIRDDLHRANMKYTLREYISMAIFTVAVTFVVETILMSFIFSIINIGILNALILALTLSFAMSGMLFFLFYSYPATNAQSRDKGILKDLPFATSYMSAIASGNVTPSAIFKSIATFKEFKEISSEISNISRDVDMVGMTVTSSIKKQAERTPSKELKDLLWGMNAILSSGGDLIFYLRNKSEEFMNDYRRRIRKYSQTLNLLVEIYLTLIITGSIFFIVLSTVIATISGGLGITNIQGLVVFLLLPGISIAFLVMIKTLSPTE